MAHEKRIIEVVVKAVGDADLKRLARELATMRKEAASSRGELVKANQELAKVGKEAAQARREIEKTNSTLGGFGSTLGTVGKAFAAGFAVKQLVASSEAVQDLTQHARDLAGTFIDATFAAVGFTSALDDEFWMTAKQGALDLADAIGSVFDIGGNQQMPEFMKWIGPLGLLSGGQLAWKKYAEDVRFDASTLGFDTETFRQVEQEVAQGFEKIAAELNAAIFKERQQQIDALREHAERMAQAAREASPAGLRIAGADSYRHPVTSLAPDAEAFAREMENAASVVREIKIDMDAIGDSVEDVKIETFGWTDGLENALAIMQEMQDAQSDLTTQALEWGNALTSSFKGVLTGELHNTRDLLRSITTQMRDYYAELAAREAAMALIRGIGGLFGGGGGFFSGLFGGASAKGNAFDKGELVPMANGGIVTKPTIFPMAHGMGLMGEAGPEAVMPLKRNREGKLGVAASMPAITVVNNLGVAAAARTEYQGDGRMSIILEAAQMGANMAEQRINNSMRSGYGVTAQSMQGAYGLRRRV